MKKRSIKIDFLNVPDFFLDEETKEIDELALVSEIQSVNPKLKIRRHFYFAFSLLYRRQSLKRLKVSLKMPKSVWQKS